MAAESAWGRFLNWLADLWWRMSGRASPWTWRERRAAVRAAEEIVLAGSVRPAPGARGSSRPDESRH